MPTIEDLMAQQAAQQAQLQSRWDEYMNLQMERADALAAKQEVAGIVSTAQNEVVKGVNDAFFVMGQFEKVINKNAVIHHANELGVDTHGRAADGIDPNLVSGNQHEDWSYLFRDNDSPFDRNPADLAEEAQALGEGAGSIPGS